MELLSNQSITGAESGEGKKKFKERASPPGHKVAKEAGNEVASEAISKRTSVAAFA